MAVLRMRGLCIHYALRSRMHLPPSVLQQGPNARIVKPVPKTTASRQSLDQKGTPAKPLHEKWTTTRHGGPGRPYDFRMQPDWITRTEAVMQAIADDFALADTTDFPSIVRRSIDRI